MNSRQTRTFSILIMLFIHSMIFNQDYSILKIDHKIMENIEHFKKIKKLYIQLPFFLQIGVTNWNLKDIKLENKSFFQLQSSKNIGLGYNPSLFIINNFSQIPDSYIYDIYNSIIPTISSQKNNKFIISSRPNGYNFFLNLVENSERSDNDPLKNNYNTLRTYWWQIPGRDEKWKDEVIKKIGYELFLQEYDLSFMTKQNLERSKKLNKILGI